jgi:hypothetical protein
MYTNARFCLQFLQTCCFLKIRQGTVKYVFENNTPEEQANVWFMKLRHAIRPTRWYLFTKLLVSRDANTKTLTMTYKVNEEEELNDATRNYKNNSPICSTPSA